MEFLYYLGQKGKFQFFRSRTPNKTTHIKGQRKSRGYLKNVLRVSEAKRTLRRSKRKEVRFCQ